jgi:hypothetical protein
MYLFVCVWVCTCMCGCGWGARFVARLWSELVASDETWMDTHAYQQMKDQIRMRGHVPLVPVPWDSPYLLVDLSVDYNETLLRDFFDALVWVPAPRPASTTGDDKEDEGDDGAARQRAYDEWVRLLALEHTEPLPSAVDVRAAATDTTTTPVAVTKVTHVVLGLKAPPVWASGPTVYTLPTGSPPHVPSRDETGAGAAAPSAAASGALALVTGARARLGVTVPDVDDGGDHSGLASVGAAASAAAALPARAAGGVILEYFPSNNVGLISHLALAVGEAARLGDELLTRALEILTVRAHEHGFFGGCDAIFLEAKRFVADEDDDDDDHAEGRRVPTPSAALTGPHMDSEERADGRGPVDMTAALGELQRLGWALMDLSYEPPPHGLAAWTAALAWTQTTRRPRPRRRSPADTDTAAATTAATTATTATEEDSEVDVLLLVRVDSNTPREVHAETTVQYLPRATVVRFLDSHWRARTAPGPLSHPAYRRMVDQVRRREQVPLVAELPWDTPCLVVSLRDDVEVELLEQVLRRFTDTTASLPPGAQLWHDEFLGTAGTAPAPPTTTTAAWVARWRAIMAADDAPVHLLLAVKYHQQTAQPLAEGALVARYLPAVNCGLLSALRLTRAAHQQQLASALLDAGLARLAVEATAAGHVAGCHAVLFEAVLPERLDGVAAPAPMAVAVATAAAAVGVGGHASAPVPIPTPPPPLRTLPAWPSARPSPVPVAMGPRPLQSPTMLQPSPMRLLSRLPSTGGPSPFTTTTGAAAGSGVHLSSSPYSPPLPAVVRVPTPPTVLRRSRAGLGTAAELLAPPGVAHTHPQLAFLDMPYLPGRALGVCRTELIPVKREGETDVAYLPPSLVAKVVAARQAAARAGTLGLAQLPAPLEDEAYPLLLAHLATRKAVPLCSQLGPPPPATL